MVFSIPFIVACVLAFFMKECCVQVIIEHNWFRVSLVNSLARSLFFSLSLSHNLSPLCVSIYLSYLLSLCLSGCVCEWVGNEQVCSLSVNRIPSTASLLCLYQMDSWISIFRKSYSYESSICRAYQRVFGSHALRRCTLPGSQLILFIECQCCTLIALPWLGGWPLASSSKQTAMLHRSAE